MPVPVKVRALFVSARLTRRKVGQDMDGETNGGQEAAQGAQDTSQQQAKSSRKRRGISLVWRLRDISSEAKSVMAVYVDKSIDEFIPYDNTERVLIMPWKESDLTWFKAAYRPVIVEVDQDGILVPLANQPELQSVKELIPEGLDERLEFMARSAAGYENRLQRIELERFKGELNKRRGEWMTVEANNVLLRCAELGMSSGDAEEICEMLRKAQGGHTFRPRRGYEDGWGR